MMGLTLTMSVVEVDLFNKAVNMTTLLREMRANLGEDKLICVDGFIEKITEEGWQYADYAVAQAYGTSRPSLTAK